MRIDEGLGGTPADISVRVFGPDLDELARLAGDIATTIFHPVGTTKMGADDDPMAVLDSKFRVRGVERKGGGVAEPLGELELVRVEDRVVADAVARGPELDAPGAVLDVEERDLALPAAPGQARC